MLYLNDEHTFVLSNVLIKGLRSPSANFSFCLISFVIPLPATDLSAYCKWSGLFVEKKIGNH